MKVILLSLLMFFGAHAFAQKEYHVSVSGNDANDGTLTKPFKTIQAAANLAMPGDIITVHAGIYREQITPPRGGDSDSRRIVYQAAPGEKVDIKGSEVITGWTKVQNDTWVVKIPNSLFGSFNPFSELIHGDWFAPTPKDRKYHRGAVYLDGDWLMESANKEEVLGKINEKMPLWWAEVDSSATTVWAQFRNVDPNQHQTEINVRPTVFYPDKPFINFITLKGFTLEQAVTNWAPPTAEQMGLVGTHWSRGWIIENNTVLYSKCVGIALGKYGDAFDNKDTESAEGYVGTIKRALAFGWNKSTIGSHVVRNNTIAYCEQTGIVGSMGCAFSIIEGNTIHDIHIRQLFSGAEMAGIKFHGAVDVRIAGNHIYKTNMAIWLDWMAQGVQVSNNLLHDNGIDLFLEVDHGPMLIYNNLMLSSRNLLMNSKGAAFAHNLFAGSMDVIAYDSRLTPVLKPHSTDVAKLHDNQGGDIQFVNNLFVKGANASQYGKALLPVLFKGNVFTKGSILPVADALQKRFGELTEAGKQKFNNMAPVDAKIENSVVDTTFNADLKLLAEQGKMVLEFTTNPGWLNPPTRTAVSTETLGKALIPGLPFENADGSTFKLGKDYSGMLRNNANPSPGPFELKIAGKQKIKVW